MGARAATPFDLRTVTRFVASVLPRHSAIIGSVLPAPLAAGAVAGWPRLLPGLFGMRSSVRVHLEEQAGRTRSAALVYESRRPEWVVLLLVADPTPDGADGAFRLLSTICAAAARSGMHRVFGSVPDEVRARETFFQAGFYSYTREAWYVSPLRALARPSQKGFHSASSVDAHDLFRFYVATTPHAVQRAEQLTVQDFDVGQRAGAFAPPHLIGGNPLAMRRASVLFDRTDHRPHALAVAFRGLERHPHVLKVRTDGPDVDRARDLLRVVAQDLPADRPLAAPVRSYEEHVARALLSEGFRESATAMLFVKELALRIEEPALAPAVVR
ncbi:MAG: hypothetical protein HYX56_00710 [Chloroflexi bacterium]|nr:hypothetical protein [Chloroflexota bacterium]